MLERFVLVNYLCLFIYLYEFVEVYKMFVMRDQKVIGFVVVFKWTFAYFCDSIMVLELWVTINWKLSSFDIYVCHK